MLMNMMRKYLLLAVTAFVLCGCQGQAVKNYKDEAQAVANRVQEIYQAVFKEYNLEDSLRNLGLPIETSAWERRNELNTLYCSTEWNEAFNKVEEIHSLLNGWWEADYWIMGQDWHNLSISDIEVVSIDKDKAVVEFQLHNCDSTRPVRVIMVKENGIWKIDTFIDEEGCDWKKDMQESIKESQELVNKIHSILNGFREADFRIKGQDRHNLSISDIKVVQMDADRAKVEFQLHNSDSTQTMHVFMVKENGIWKIDTSIDQEDID